MSVENGEVTEAAGRAYEPPSIERLGTLADLTQGGSTGPSDAVAGSPGAGDSGSLS
jgi:hypothetical protein